MALSFFRDFIMPLMSHKNAKVLAKSLDEETLREQIEKAVLTEGQVGSTTVIPILFFGFAERFDFSSANKLAAWACENTNNQYVPFGSGVTRAKDYRQFLIEQVNKKVVRAENEAMDQLVHARKQKQKRRAGQKHAEVRDQAAVVRKEFLKTLGELTPVERICKIIELDVPLESVPFDQLEISEKVINSLDAMSNLNLVGMIGNRKKGPWITVRKWLERV
jgi:hypothetical protein